MHARPILNARGKKPQRFGRTWKLLKRDFRSMCGIGVRMSAVTGIPGLNAVLFIQLVLFTGSRFIPIAWLRLRHSLQECSVQVGTGTAGKVSSECETIHASKCTDTNLCEMQNAGLHTTEYARQALANVKVSNAGAYRHHVAQSTQLW